MNLDDPVEHKPKQILDEFILDHVTLA